MEIIKTNNSIIFITSPNDEPPWRNTMSSDNEVWTIERTPGAKWIVKSVRHLTGEENHGNHHIYVDAENENGEDLRNTGLNITYGWDGMKPDEAAPIVPINKPEGEFGGNVPIFLSTAMYISMHGAPSEVVRNLRTDFGDNDGEDGNSWGHQSFHVVFSYRPEGRKADPVQQRETPIEGPVTVHPIQEPSIFVGDLQWEYYPSGGMPHHQAKIANWAQAIIIEAQTGGVYARITTPTGVNLTPIQMLNTVDQAKRWIEQETQKPQYHQGEPA